MREDLDRRCEVGEDLLRDRKYSESLAHFTELLKGDASSVRVLTGASESLLGCLDDPTAVSSRFFQDRDWLCRTLIDQFDCLHTPPVLHELIARRQAASGIDLVPKIASALDGSLQKIHQEGALTKNSVLIILILRESISSWISQADISRHHLKWLPEFAVEDMALIYSFMFDRVHYQRNQADILAFLEKRPNAKDLATDFSLTQILLFEWISGRDLISDSELLSELVLPQLRPDVSRETLASAKSLLVRHCYQSTKSSELSRLPPESYRNLLELAQGVRGTRERLARGTKQVPAVWLQSFDNRTLQRLRGGVNLLLGRVPFSLGRARRPRVALCVSGQLRGYKHALSTWRRTLLKDVAFEIFVDSWIGIGRSGAEPFRSVLPFEGVRFTRTYRDACQSISFDEFKQRYPNLFSALADSALVSEAEIRSAYRTAHVHLDNDQEMPFKGWSNQQKMHAKIESSVEMARNSGIPFDLIVRIRPDKPIRAIGFSWRDLMKYCRSAPVVFADHACGVHFGNLMIGDQFAVATPEVMDVYAKTWSSYPRIANEELFRCPPEFQGHVTLAQVCWLFGVAVKKIPVSFDQLREAEPMSSRVIHDCLSLDASGRWDVTDKRLMDAIIDDMSRL